MATMFAWAITYPIRNKDWKDDE